MVKEIPLTKGQVALVDDEDYDRLITHKWQFNNSGYAVRNKWIRGGKGKYRAILMHREILGLTDEYACDHINRNRLDNRKSNLRPVTLSANCWNASTRTDNTSGYRGVSRTKNNTWVAQISINGKRMHLGSFRSAELAALVFNIAAKALHGEYAHLNEVSDEELFHGIMSGAIQPPQFP